jgi:hypothetical protein
MTEIADEEWTETSRPPGLLGRLDEWWCRTHHSGYGAEWETEDLPSGGTRQTITRAKCGDCDKPIRPIVAMERGLFGCPTCHRPY